MTIHIGILSGLVAIFLWACFPGLIKISLEGMAIPYFLVLRYFIASALLIFTVNSIIRKAPRFSWRTWALMGLMAALHNGSQAFCLKEVPVSWYVLFFSCSPVLTFFILPSQKSNSTLAYFVLAVLGTVIFLNPSEVRDYPSMETLIALFISVITWVILTRLMLIFHKEYNDLEVSFILNIFNFISGCILLGASVTFYGGTLEIQTALWPVLLLGALSPVASYLFSLSLRIVPLFGIAAQYLELIFGSLIGILMFNEIPTSYQYIGAGFIIAALIGTTCQCFQKPRLTKKIEAHLD